MRAHYFPAEIGCWTFQVFKTWKVFRFAKTENLLKFVILTPIPFKIKIAGDVNSMPAFAGILEAFVGILEAFAAILEAFAGILSAFVGILEAFVAILPAFAGILEAFVAILFTFAATQLAFVAMHFTFVANQFWSALVFRNQKPRSFWKPRG
jgi:hypothetical protein